MSNYQEVFRLESGVTINVKRIEDSQMYKYRTIAIQNSAFFKMSQIIALEPPRLAKFYAALTSLTGPSGEYYDDYKGSYNFMFELEVNKNSKISNYIYNIYHYRSYLEFSVLQIVDIDDSRKTGIFHQPNDELFSEEDIWNFTWRFCANLEVRSKMIKSTLNPFVKTSHSNILIFGYLHGEYFYEQCKTQDEYKVRMKELEGELKKLENLAE